MSEPGERDPYAPPPDDAPETPDPPRPRGDSGLPGSGGTYGGSGDPRHPGAAQPDHQGTRALLAGMASLLFLLWFPPLGLLFGVFALVAGVRAVRARRARGLSSPSGVGAIVFGPTTMLLALLGVVVVSVLYREFSAYAECMAGANTEKAKQICQDRLIDALERRFG
ncbi:hypothetical protein [Carbonactinospora thermoautotrophica]|uniref:hypothetical protein n=1 Tax=Carbonactinospora thermoautotrophica TaxID=1469144 RepID=UPI003DA7E772